MRAAVGALRAGLVVVPVNTAYTDPELEYVLTDSGAALLVVAADREPVAGVRVCAGPPEADGPAPEIAEDPAAPAFLAYTSGTTGRPRGAILTAAALRANQEQCLAMDPPPVRADDRVLLVLPLFHVYGLNAGFGLVAATGACAVLEETFDPAGSLRLMAEEHVTAVPGAPPMYQAWLAAADAAGSDAELRRGFAAMRIASCGAAPLPEDVWTAMRDRAAVTVWEGYGLTEAAPVVASTLATGPGQAGTASAARSRAWSSCCGTPRPPSTGRGATSGARPRRHRRRGRGGAGRDLGARRQPLRRVLARRRGRPGRRRLAAAPVTSPTATPTATCTSSTGAAT